MNFLQRLDAWSQKKQAMGILLIRCALGLLLWVKGFSFISHTPDLEALIAGSRFAEQGHWLAGYVTWSHLFGGVMIFLGLLTRVAILIQLPVLIGAVFFIHAGHGIMTVDPQLGVSILVLVLLIFFLIIGPGPYSMDWYLKRKLL
ncbi:MAG: DoxX family protein [Sediminibacterium sp.]